MSLNCVHCGADSIDLPWDGEEDCYWLTEDDEYTCPDCCGINRVMIDGDEAYFADCEDENCPACQAAEANE
jgi:hypothetical protein